MPLNKRSIKAIVFCLLSMVVSAFCIYELILASMDKESSQIHITWVPFLNRMIGTVNTFNGRIDIALLLGLGIIALIFELAFSDSFHEFFSRLPLGSIKKYDYFEEKPFKIKKIFKRSVIALSPALIIAAYIAVHIGFLMFFPDNTDICTKFILPVTFLLIVAVFIAFTVSIIKYGGLWGALVRLPLLFTSNVCLCVMIGATIIALGIIAISLTGIILMIKLMPTIFRLLRIFK